MGRLFGALLARPARGVLRESERVGRPPSPRPSPRKRGEGETGPAMTMRRLCQYASMLGGPDVPRFPLPEIVAAVVAGAEHDDIFVGSVMKKFLHRFIRAIGIPDDDAGAARRDVVQPPFHLRGQTRQVARAADENGIL